MMEERRKPDQSVCGRREHCALMEEESIEKIAEKAADKAIAKLTAHVYQEIGRNIVGKFLWLIGAITAGMAIWMHGKGLLK